MTLTRPRPRSTSPTLNTLARGIPAGRGPPASRSPNSVNRTSWTRSPPTANGAQRNPRPVRPSRLPRRMSPRTTPTGIAQSMNIRSDASRVQDLAELDDVLLQVSGHEPIEERGHGGHAANRVEPLARGVGFGELAHAMRDARAVRAKPREELPERHGPVATDDPDPDDIGRDAPERDGGPGLPFQDSLGLSQPEREHLIEVGEQLGRTPARLGFRAVQLGERPGSSGFHPRSQGEDRVDRGLE